jgi:hypothetical protein
MARNPHKNPNPQGKGLVAVLADWQDTRPRGLREKAPSVLLRDWFTSALVLSASFRFRPAVGQAYYLYSRRGEWRLSLIGPEEWGGRDAGACLGRCELRPDMTWHLDAADDLDRQPELRAELEALIESFTEQLGEEGRLADQLPGYRRDLPYHQRMLATALGASLRDSAGRADWLEAPARTLLSGAGSGGGLRRLVDASAD